MPVTIPIAAGVTASAGNERKILAEYAVKLDIEVLSGGMMTSDTDRKIGHYIQNATRGRINGAFKIPEKIFLHINHPTKNDWVMNSEKAIIALCIFKNCFPNRQLDFATDLLVR